MHMEALLSRENPAGSTRITLFFDVRPIRRINYPQCAFECSQSRLRVTASTSGADVRPEPCPCYS